MAPESCGRGPVVSSPLPTQWGTPLSSTRTLDQMTSVPGSRRHFISRRIALLIDVLHNAEDAAFGVDRANAAVFGNPHLGQVVSDEMVSGHGRGGFAAAAGGGAGDPGDAAVGTLDTGDEHVFGQFQAPFFIHRAVNGKAVVALFHQQRVAGIGAFECIGGAVAAVHQHPGVGQIFTADCALRCGCWCKNVLIGRLLFRKS